jgi:predicted lipoprotein
MKSLGLAILVAAASIPLTHPATAETEVGHWADHGFAHTTLAPNALSITAEIWAKKTMPVTCSLIPTSRRQMVP